MTGDDGTRGRPGAMGGAGWTVVRRVVLGLFACVVLVIALLAGQVLLSAAGVGSDPHGYTMIFGVLLAAVLTPVALVLWMLYRALHRRR